MTYYNNTEHQFMTAVTEILIGCGWDDDEAFTIAYEALTLWQNGFRYEE